MNLAKYVWAFYTENNKTLLKLKPWKMDRYAMFLIFFGCATRHMRIFSNQNQTHALSLGALRLNCWTTREVLHYILILEASNVANISILLKLNRVQKWNYTYDQLIFNQSMKSIQWGKDSLFNKWCWNNYRSWGKNELQPQSHPLLKINLRYITDQHKAKTIKLSEEKEKSNLGFGKEFLEIKQKMSITKKKRNLILSKLLLFLRNENWRRIFTMHVCANFLESQ